MNLLSCLIIISLNIVSFNATSANLLYTEQTYKIETEVSTEMSISAYVVSAICGNFWTESGVNPGVWESLTLVSWDSVWHNNTGGYGLGQWTNTGGDSHGRLYKLHQYLSSNGYADDSMEGQAKYIEVENVWHKGTSAQQAITYQNLQEFLTSASTDLNYLTKSWLLCWEGINNGTLAKRQEQAQKAFNYIMAHYNDSNIKTYYHSNSYLSESQILNNCVMLYRIMSNGGSVTPEPPEPEPTGRKHKMPVWMMVRYRR